MLPCPVFSAEEKSKNCWPVTLSLLGLLAAFIKKKLGAILPPLLFICAVNREGTSMGSPFSPLAAAAAGLF